jgi:hypothetical protein
MPDARRGSAAGILIALVMVAAGLAMSTPASASTGDPIGAFDEIRVAAGAHVVRGWAADPDAPGAAVELHVYVNGFRQTYLGAAYDYGPVHTGVARPDVAAVYPWVGERGGFEIPVPNVTPGAIICVYAINQSAGANNTTLGCLRAPADETSSSDPFGVLDEIVVVSPGALRIRGWAADPDATNPMTVHIGFSGAPSYLNQSGVTLLTRLFTGASRPDVTRTFPTLGEATGFDETFFLAPHGAYHLCAWAINQGPGWNNTTLGCRDVTMPSTARPGPIVGSFDNTTYDTTEVGAHYIPGTTRARGWAFDPRHPDQPVQIRVRYFQFVGSGFPVPRTSVGATGDARPDVAAAVAGAGPDQGFSVLVGDTAVTGYPPRPHIAVYAIDPDGGPDVLLGFR